MAIGVGRRQFIGALGGAAVAWPLVALAQEPKPVPRVGVLTLGPGNSPIDEAFRQGLGDFGYVVGQNILLENRFAAGKADRLDQFAAELVAAKVDVILSSGSEATTAVRRQTNAIPIVMTSSNPVGLGFVASLARPGGNITGLSVFAPETSSKRLELLKNLLPRITKVALFWNPNDPSAKFSLTETQSAAKVMSVELQILETREVADFDGAFQAAAKASAAAVILLPAPVMSRNATRIAELALQSRLPTLFPSGDAVEAGGLLSYGPNLLAIYRRAAYYVDRILKGAKPADLPVEQPTKFELAVNLNTAKALGLDVPPQLLALADEVIE
jgi:putative ABC transport system substrate-binding protein